MSDGPFREKPVGNRFRESGAVKRLGRGILPWEGRDDQFSSRQCRIETAWEARNDSVCFNLTIGYAQPTQKGVAMKTLFLRSLVAGSFALCGTVAAPALAQVTYSFTGSSANNFIIVGPQSFTFTQDQFISQNTTVSSFTAGNATSALFCFAGVNCFDGIFSSTSNDNRLVIRTRGGQASYSLTGLPSPFTMDGVSFATGSNAGTLTVSGTPVSVPTGAVPEPATWAMMILGMGAVGYILRRRRAAVQGYYAA